MFARGAVSLLSFLFLLVHAPCIAGDRGARSGNKEQSPVEIEQRIFEAVNGIRQKNGLRPLRHSPELQSMARLHSLDMANHEYLGHVDSRGQDLKARALALNLADWRMIAENVARAFGHRQSGEAMLKEWLTSREHRENILEREFAATGVGVVRDRNGYYYATQIFIRSTQ
ncbi:MAG: CAP domain-containing protein [Geobacteraceae bacterium]|nr:CAP domain-containing protein [Geobacteraceae bacterium]